MELCTHLQQKYASVYCLSSPTHISTFRYQNGFHHLVIEYIQLSTSCFSQNTSNTRTRHVLVPPLGSDMECPHCSILFDNGQYVVSCLFIYVYRLKHKRISMEFVLNINDVKIRISYFTHQLMKYTCPWVPRFHSFGTNILRTLDLVNHAVSNTVNMRERI